MKKKNLIITGIVVVLAIIALVVFNKKSAKKEISNLFVEAEKGQFDIVVTTTGELEAETSVDIMGPQITLFRGVRFADIEITDMVPEGTEVKEGDYVATLNRTTFENTLKDELEELSTLESSLELKTLDTAVTLSGLRDAITTCEVGVEEAEITLQESKYEPPTTIRQAELDLEKAKRALIQARKNYELNVETAKSEVRTSKYNLSEQRQKVNDLQKVLSGFTITAPSSGMIIYKRLRDGSKRKVGSSISPWDLVVATLPNMTTMISKTYVNEIDVSKVKPGQRVSIVVDAFPERKYTGTVTSVANIGEQLPNADAKVFEVLIKVDGTDNVLRPSMTTGNKINTKTIDNVVYIPLECVQAGADSIPFVYMKNGTRHYVVVGESNETSVVVEQGLEAGALLYLSTPEEPEKFKITGEELIAVNRAKARAKAEQAAEQQRKQEVENAMRSAPGGMPGPGFMPGQGGPGGQRDTAAIRKFRQQGGRPGGPRPAQNGSAPATRGAPVN